MNIIRWKRYVLLATAVVLGSGIADRAGADGAWLLIDSDQRTLSVMEDDHKPLEVFENVAFGRGGVAPFRLSGDGKTPTGEFNVAWINPDSRYHLFIGLDYPRPAHAQEGYRRQIIDVDTYINIREAHYRHRVPPQDTELGGDIGIHGLGDSDPEIHRLYDWTMGCVALTDQQIDSLASWVTLGMKVVIR